MKGLYPNERIAFTLPLHNHVPEADRPKLYARFFTGKERIEMSRLVDEAVEAEQAADHGKSMDCLIAALRLLLVGWDLDMAFQLDANHLLDHFDTNDLWDLFTEARKAVDVRRDALKKSARQSPSDSATSVDPAAPASIDKAAEPAA